MAAANKLRKGSMFLMLRYVTYREENHGMIYNILYNKMKQDLPKIIGEAVLLSSMNFAIGSVELSSRFSVINFSKTQDVLDRAHDALVEYMYVGLFWTLGCMLILYANHKWAGLISGFVCNILILLWIYFGYQRAFNKAAKNNNLRVPKLFK